MKTTSYMRARGELLPVEVEVSLTPGLPQFFFLGLPDAAIKESELRVKSALRLQGFEPPRAHQTLVHLRPSHVRKTSRGLDLAVAAAVLWATGQLPKPKWEGAAPILYGELSLAGEILRPDDLDELEEAHDGRPVLTGPGEPHPYLETWVARDLRALAEPERFAPREPEAVALRPPVPRASWSAPAAALLATIAAGEHSCVIAGPPGSGKTSVAEGVNAFLAPPSSDELRRARRLARAEGVAVPSWRPFVQPHHSLSPLAMVGGGRPPQPGEITRAHGGVLVLDELMEFHPSILESLREPLDSGLIRLARGPAARTFPARFALVATTNLCHCGTHDPFAEESPCTCRRALRERHLDRLSGPFLDRTHILAFSGDWRQAPHVSSEEVLARVERAERMRSARGQREPNGRVAYETLAQRLDKFELEQIAAGSSGSARRSMAIVRVARTLADLDGAETIASAHWSQAMRWCASSYERLRSRV